MRSVEARLRKFRAARTMKDKLSELKDRMANLKARLKKLEAKNLPVKRIVRIYWGDGTFIGEMRY